MKTKILLCLLAVTIVTTAQSVNAQVVGSPYVGGYCGDCYGGQVYEPGAFQPVVGELPTAMPGRIWVGASAADQGLGYQGSYATIGMKSRLCEDFMDGRWLGEARFHQSLNGGGFFSNIGLERVFSIDPANADVSVGFWYDYDSDVQGDFGHAFSQVGVTAQIKKVRWDLIGNGYFTVGSNNYTQGDPTGVNCFFNHSIIVEPGIDSALQGFDVTLRTRPEKLGLLNGTFEIAGYGYDSDLVDFFGGGRLGWGFQALGGMIVKAEVNYDTRFDVTGVVSVGWIFGVNARGNEYAGIGRDLEETNRNDHIVRYQQDAVLAIDPDTGRPYDVYHVDNTADAAYEDGTVETPFTTLAAAEAASADSDIIFVHEGDGTANGMNEGITLKNNQYLFGDGVRHIIPIQDGLNFILCNRTDGNRPTISGSNNGNAVTLAENNVVAGLEIDGTQGVGGMAYGIFGDGVALGNTISNGVIRDNFITGAILDGVHVEDIDGDWDFLRNEIKQNGFDGTRILNACDSTSILTFADNDVSENGRDGISLENYDAARLIFQRNTTNDNGRDGIRLVNFKNMLGTGLELNFAGSTSSGNNGFGINIIGGEGNLRILNANITGNLSGGLSITDWTNTDPATSTFIGTTTNGTSNFSGNGAGVGINVVLNSGIQRLLVTDSTVNGNGYGIVARANGVGTNMISRIMDNQSVSNNSADGIRIIAENGATHNTLIDEVGPSGGVLRLPISGNGGSGIAFLAGNDAGGVVSEIEATVRNMSITGSLAGDGIFGSINLDGSLQLTVEDSNIDGNGLSGMNFQLNANSTNIVNNIYVNNITMLDNGGSGINVNSAIGTFTNISVIGSVFENTTAIAANGDNNTLRAGGFGAGISLFQDGDVGTPEIDGRLQALIQANSINRYLAEGISIDSAGDAHIFAQIDGNDLDQNGYGLASAGNGTGTPQIVSPPPVPAGVFNGVRITSSDSSEIDLRMSQNDIMRSSDSGLLLQTLGTSRINALLVGNDFANNDYANDPTDDPIRQDLGIDFVISNTLGSEMCVAMSSNFYTTLPNVGHPVTGGFSATGGFSIFNTGAPADLALELDGNTNLFGPADVLAPAVFPPYGTVCEPLIDAEEAAFLAAGFPPID